MKLNVVVNEDMYQIDVPEYMLFEAREIYEKMDNDMNQGWQLGRDWVDDPNPTQRCQVAADRLLTAIENDNEASKHLMAGYIMTKFPDIESIYIATDGDLQQTQIVVKPQR